jgi:adenylate cyclase
METSLITTRQIGFGVILHLNSLVENIEIISTGSTSLIENSTDISGTNKVLVNYLLTSVIQNPLVAAFHMANVNGEFVSARNLTLTNQTHYVFDMSKELPQGIRYGIVTISKSGDSFIEEWNYLDTDLNVISSEKSSSLSLSPLTRPWFTEIAVWPRTSWTEPYNVFTNTPGISFSTPIIINDTFIGVAGADLALSGLSRVISDIVVGKTGKAFVLNEAGEILLPQTVTGTLPYIIEEAYNQSLKTAQRNFVLNSVDQSFVIEIFNFPLDISTDWTIMTAVPLSDFFDPILKSQLHSIQIGFIVLLIATVLIYIASGRIAKPINQLAGEVERIRKFDFSEVNPVQSNIYEVSVLSSSIQTMRKTFASFTKYVPKDIVEKLIALDQVLVTGGERRNMTILFSDIQNFTTIAETLSVEQVTTMLTEYFELFTKIIVAQEGTIDKYIGDSVMAIWNAPNFVVNHAEKACLACLNFIGLTKSANLTNPFLKGTTRFGINTGEVIVGNIGTTERISYTAIGTVVNTASRFQTLNKTYNTNIIIGETVKESLGKRFITRPLDLIAVKGRNQPIQIYELMGVSEGEPQSLILTKEEIELSKEFTEAFYSFHKGTLTEAKNKFLALAEKFPNDEATKLYLSRIASSK